MLYARHLCRCVILRGRNGNFKGLQRLLDICGDYCAKWDICLNAKKTKNMSFGAKRSISYQLRLNGVAVKWTEEWKYLAVVLNSGKRFDCSVKYRVKSLYRSLNSVLAHMRLKLSVLLTGTNRVFESGVQRHLPQNILLQTFRECYCSSA